MKGNSLEGIPASGEGLYIMSSDLEGMSGVLRKVVVGVANCFDDPGGDSSRLDLLGVAWLVGYAETFPALTEILGTGKVHLDGMDHAVVGINLKVRANKGRKSLEVDVSQAGLRAAGAFDLSHK